MTLTKRYVEGFLEYARETIGQDRALQELKFLKDVMRDNLELKEFLENPVIAYSEKCASADKMFADTVSPETRNFLKLLLKKERMNIFGEIAEYARIKYSHGEEIDAVLKSAYPLDTDMLQELKSGLERKLNKRLHFYMDMDSSLVGGFQITIGNMILDGSVKKELEEMKDKLMAVKVA
jgi:F-type H+-transporting ATPase subunit delta